MSFTTLRTFLMSSKTVPLSSGFALSRKSEQGPSPIRHSRFQHKQQHTLQLTYYRNTSLIFKYISAYGSIIILPLRCLDKYNLLLSSRLVMHLLQIPTEDENLSVNNRQHDEIFLEERSNPI
ncbi:hypothetical protein T08_7578 [Trichinella sp. T8]|nr:hypothetical protein T08_7578 [Trichinella sp. T8]